MKVKNMNDKAELAKLMTEISQKPAKENDIETGPVSPYQ